MRAKTPLPNSNVGVNQVSLHCSSHVHFFCLLRASLTVRDNRTNKEQELKIGEGNYVRATDFQKFKDQDGEGLRVFDPSYANTAVVKSAICFIDGDKGILEYRGYPIEELAEKSTFLEVAYLLIFGELPTKVNMTASIFMLSLHYLGTICRLERKNHETYICSLTHESIDEML